MFRCQRSPVITREFGRYGELKWRESKLKSGGKYDGNIRREREKTGEVLVFQSGVDRARTFGRHRADKILDRVRPNIKCVKIDS